MATEYPQCRPFADFTKTEDFNKSLTAGIFAEIKRFFSIDVKGDIEHKTKEVYKGFFKSNNRVEQLHHAWLYQGCKSIYSNRNTTDADKEKSFFEFLGAALKEYSALTAVRFVTMEVQTGSVYSEEGQFWKKVDNSRISSVNVQFGRQFAEPPKVLLTPTMFVINGEQIVINVWVTNITKLGFIANFGTWGTSIVHQSWGTYMAIGKPKVIE